MAIVDGLLQELSHESASTRRMLERIPEADLGWSPHPKSMTFARLGAHLAEIPGLAKPIVTLTELDMKGHKFVEPKKVADILAAFDAATETAQGALRGVSDSALMVPWSLKFEGKVIFSMPRIAALRTVVFSHSYHHRGQLSVFLRLRNVAVPSVYGPSADEGLPH
jgi:uncharacterized damage-inducible protein DinB